MMKRRDWYCEDVLSGKMAVSVIWEDENVLAFDHPKPTAEIHVVIIPKRHIDSLLDPRAVDGTLLECMLKAVQQSAAFYQLDKLGFYVRANAGTDGVTPHMHWHLYGPGIP